MLAALVVNVGNQILNQPGGGRFPPKLLVGGGKHQERQKKQGPKEYSIYINWLRKKKDMQRVATPQLIDKLDKAGILITNELLNLDDEDFIVLWLLTVNNE